ncbi:dolichol-phosphate mannosyltransferase [Saccharopolyspora antimicrobica]|uniref:Dolichol-phosphate mannosyltransferase n=1 Tax=Saccharopolyspora antimicrobica TaxID=455193 RepID=A0A1I4YXJ1_9PSEU|nr:glycosyltransferase family 2 protein [Saccharopolyspora antimicrobica]RKT82851.1 dolichol-phosphate mannosyltransferase [Saccharopolyspora antimicrobica]SFN42677.1 dolichol-phosphate mannosyltransferase [Saccharopolyspora antimicrobica]
MTQTPLPQVSLLAPAKNEQENLPALFAQISEAMQQQDRSWELVVVDDGSTDGSWQVISEHAARDPRIRGIRLRRNFGKAAALAAGVAEVRGELLVTLDADLQDDPAEIPRLLAELDAGTDLVSGHKANRQDPLGKRLPSKVFNWFTGLITGLKLSDHNCGLKAARTEVYRRVPLYGELHRYIPALAHQLGYRVAEMPVNHRPRLHGKSKYGLERYLRGALDLLTVVALTRYGRRPAHLFGGLGMLAGTIGTLILLYLTGVWLFTDQPIGTRPLLTLGILLEIFAVQMISVGLLAELVLHRTGRDHDVDVLVADQTPTASAAA